MDRVRGTPRDVDSEQQREVTARLRVAIGAAYDIERELGRGGMATVHLARDVRHQRLVALKVLDPALGAALGGPRFRREITLAAQLQHPHIVPVFDSGETADEDLWYTMPFVEGESLRSRLRRERRLSLPAVQTLARQIASALDYAHRRGTVHRDIKPENILLGEDGDALVADFGIARQVAHPDDGRLTATGLSLGTPGYMSPEQIAGEREVDGRADQYALACLVYEALVGHPPYEGSTAHAIMLQHAAAPVPRLREERPSIPPSVEAAVSRAMSKSPNDRFPSVGAFAEALGYEEPTTADAHEVPAPPGTEGGDARRGAWRIAFIATASILLLAAGGAWWWRSRAEAQRAVPAFDPERTAVTSFVNRTGDPSLDKIVSDFEESVTQGIAQLPDVEIVATDEVRAAERRLATRPANQGRVDATPETSSLGLELGAGVLIGGSVSRGIGDSLVLRATLTDGRTGRLVSALTRSGSAASAASTLIDSVRDHIRGGVALVRAKGRGALVGREPPSYAPVWELSAAVALESRGDPDPALQVQHLETAIRLDSNFLLPRIHAARMYAQFGGEAGVKARRGDSAFKSLNALTSRMTTYELAMLAFDQAGIRGDKLGMIDAIRRAVAADSTTPLIGYLPWRLVGANRMREYLEIERVMSRTLPPRFQKQPESANGWILRTTSRHMLGDHGKELLEARAARTAHPSGLVELGYLAIALAALDSVAAVEELMTEALTLPVDRSNENDVCVCKTAGSLMATVASELEVHGNPVAARRLYERSLSWYHAPGNEITSVERLRATALQLMALERWEEARPILDSLLQARTETGSDFANSDRIYYAALNGILDAHDGGRAGAEFALRELNRYAQSVAIDDAEERSRVHLLEAQIHAALGQRDEAVALLRSALPVIGEPYYLLFVHRSASFRSLRDSPSFVALMQPH